jgi:hypothetical protein
MHIQSGQVCKEGRKEGRGGEWKGPIVNEGKIVVKEEKEENRSLKKPFRCASATK